MPITATLRTAIAYATRGQKSILHNPKQSSLRSRKIVLPEQWVQNLGKRGDRSPDRQKLRVEMRQVCRSSIGIRLRHIRVRNREELAAHKKFWFLELSATKVPKCKRIERPSMQKDFQKMLKNPEGQILNLVWPPIPKPIQVSKIRYSYKIHFSTTLT